MIFATKTCAKQIGARPSNLLFLSFLFGDALALLQLPSLQPRESQVNYARCTAPQKKRHEQKTAWGLIGWYHHRWILFSFPMWPMWDEPAHIRPTRTRTFLHPCKNPKRKIYKTYHLIQTKFLSLSHSRKNPRRGWRSSCFQFFK